MAKAAAVAKIASFFGARSLYGDGRVGGPTFVLTR